VLLTDLPELLSLMEENIALNRTRSSESERGSERGSEREPDQGGLVAAACTLTWGTAASQLAAPVAALLAGKQGQGIDVLIGADVLYVDYAVFRALLVTLRQLAS
jgi:hypothetical protein